MVQPTTPAQTRIVTREKASQWGIPRIRGNATRGDVAISDMESYAPATSSIIFSAMPGSRLMRSIAS